MDRKILKEIILKDHLIDESRLRELEAMSASSGESLLNTIINGGYIREDSLLPLLASFFGLDWVNIEALTSLDATFFRQLPSSLKKDNRFLPLYQENGMIVVALADPMEIEMIDRLKESTGWHIKMVLSSREKINRIRERFETQGLGNVDQSEILTELKGEHPKERALEELANEAPTIKLVNLLLMQAISEGASDIHIEPYEKEQVVRYRIDGVLRKISSHPKEQSPAIVSRIKIMADLNVAEHRIPQDGRISLRLMEKGYDLRVAIIPTLTGEGVVIRILDKESISINISKIGFSSQLQTNFIKQINKPNGIILVTGPTGSGKTTTLYAAVNSIKSDDKKIITIEDPVEYNLEGITQIHVNAKVGLSFAAGLRSILRLDPDIIMVGEIRDSETAEIAIRAALTGHLVLSTLHTNDAPSAITRLTDMKIEPYLISSSLNAVLSQRLVRKICQFCKSKIKPGETEYALFNVMDPLLMPPVYKGKGCDECSNVGYMGRIGIHELLEVSEPIRELINQKGSSTQIRETAKKMGMKVMKEDGISKIEKGITTAEEVFRVTQVDS